MSKRIRFSYSQIKKISEAKKPEAKKTLAKANEQLIDAISELALNAELILHSVKYKRQLHRNQKLLNALSVRNSPARRRKRLLIQNLPFIFTLLKEAVAFLKHLV